MQTIANGHFISAARRVLKMAKHDKLDRRIDSLTS